MARGLLAGRSTFFGWATPYRAPAHTRATHKVPLQVSPDGDHPVGPPLTNEAPPCCIGVWWARDGDPGLSWVRL